MKTIEEVKEFINKLLDICREEYAAKNLNEVYARGYALSIEQILNFINGDSNEPK